jgi:hypothetical protein
MSWFKSQVIATAGAIGCGYLFRKLACCAGANETEKIAFSPKEFRKFTISKITEVSPDTKVFFF